MFFLSFFRRKRGSFTVEASLIASVAILVVCVMVFLVMLLYQQAYLGIMADKACERGAALWPNPEGDIVTGKTEIKDLNAGGLYWRLPFFESNKKKKESRTASVIWGSEEPGQTFSGLDRYSVLKSNGKMPKGRVRVLLIDYVVYKQLKVSVEDTYPVPLGRVFRIFGLEGGCTLRAEASGIIQEPAEFIRNTDFVLDVEEEAEERFERYGNAVGSLRDTMDKVKQRIEEFLK